MLHRLELLCILAVDTPLADVRLADARDGPATATDALLGIGYRHPRGTADNGSSLLQLV
jgi:hypothetical protein